MQLLSSYLASSTSLSTPREWRIYTVSRPFTPDYDIDAILHSVGAGGGGAAACHNTFPTATGGCSGSYVRKRVTLKAGVTYNFAIGAPGVGGIANASTPASNGSNGGDTTITGGGLNIVAGGGRGGKATVGAVGTPTDGGLPGTASGGDLNRIGNRGGNIPAGTYSGSSYTAHRASGGGGVPLTGEGGHGGDMVVGNYTMTASYAVFGSGGGGIGADAPDLPSSGSAGTNAVLGGGVGSLSNLLATTALTLPGRNFMGFWGVLGPVSNGGDAGPFCGGPGNLLAKAGVFAGGGGLASSTTTASLVGNDGQLGGGGGGVANVATSNVQKGGAGGSGVILMEILG